MVKPLILNLTKICDIATAPNFMKLFCEEQQKYIQISCSGSVKYHPMIIKYVLYVYVSPNDNCMCMYHPMIIKYVLYVYVSPNDNKVCAVCVCITQ